MLYFKKSYVLQFSALVYMLKFVTSFQDPGQTDKVTPKAHISHSSSHRFSHRFAS